MKRAVVLGAGGFLGSHLTAWLARRGWAVTAVVHRAADPITRLRLALATDPVEVVEGDATDVDLLRTLLKSADAVFPLTGQADQFDAPKLHAGGIEEYVRPSLALLDVLRELGPSGPVAVFPGSLTQYGSDPEAMTEALSGRARLHLETDPLNPTSWYDVCKSFEETVARTFARLYGVRTCWLRISVVYGPLQRAGDHSGEIVSRFLQLARTGQTIQVYGDGSQTRDFLFVEDLMALFEAAALNPAAVGEAFNAGGPEVRSVRQMADAVVAVVGHGHVTSREWPPDTLPREMGPRHGSIEKAERLLGWRPTVGLADGLRRTLRREAEIFPTMHLPVLVSPESARGNGASGGTRRPLHQLPRHLAAAAGRHRPLLPPAGGTLGALGRWCFRNWPIAILAWVLVMVAGVLSFGPVFSSKADYAADVESSRGTKLLAAASTDSGSVVAVVDGVDLQAPRVCDVLGRLAADLQQRRDVQRVGNPCTAPLDVDLLRAVDGSAFLVNVVLTKNDDSTKLAESVDAVSGRMRRLGDELHDIGQPRARVRVGGVPVLDRDFNNLLQEDGIRVELMALPISLLFLFFVFRGLLAGFLPVLTALVASVSSMVALLGFSMVIPIAPTAITVVNLLGLGLSIDYGLLLAARYREEVMAGNTPDVAVGRACATAGRTIMFSGLTVTAALCSLLVLGLTELTAIGAAALSITVLAVVVSLTFTPALLGALRPWLTPSRRARRRGVGTDEVEQNFFGRLARVVQRRPGVVIIATTVVLVAISAPLLGATLRRSAVAEVPPDVGSVQVLRELANRFETVQEPAVVVVARTNAATLDAWARRWIADPAVSGVRPAQLVDPHLAAVQIDVTGDTQSEAAQRLVSRVRADRPPGVASWVTGDAAILVDIKGRLARSAPLAVIVLVLMMVVVLFLMTGSLLVPVKAVLANTISLAAAFGIMTAVFQDGFLTGPLDLLQVAGLDPYLLVIVFVFAFGLSMDYEVFLLSRIKEYVDLGHDTDMAVRRGLAHTGRIITSAGALMMIVFGCYATGRLGLIEQLGFGLTVAILVDATIVRALLVPATMTIMGRWNWWAPAPLRRLHERLGLRDTAPPEQSGITSVSWFARHRRRYLPTAPDNGLPVLHHDGVGAGQP